MTKVGATLLPKQTKISKSPLPDRKGTLRPENAIFNSTRPKPSKINESSINFNPDNPVKAVFVKNFGENPVSVEIPLTNFSEFQSNTKNPYSPTFWENIIDSQAKSIAKVHAASINPIDLDVIPGGAEEFFQGKAWKLGNINHESQNSRLPLVLGRDFCGELIKTDGVNIADVGQRIWGVKPVTEQGTFCEFVKMDSHLYGNAPMNISVEECAAVPYAGCTILSGFDGVISEENASEKSVLVLGGSGGLGTLAIQILKAWGCPRVDVVCSEKNKDLVKKLGCDKVCCYDSGDHIFMGKTDGYDLVINLTPQNEDKDYKYEDICRNLNEDGSYITFNTTLWQNSEKFKGQKCAAAKVIAGFEIDSIKMGMEFRKQAKNAKLGLINEYFVDKQLERLKVLIQDGKIKPVVTKVFGIGEATEVLENFKTKKYPGKVVFKI